MMPTRGPGGAAYSERGPEPETVVHTPRPVDDRHLSVQNAEAAARNAEGNRQREEAKQRALAKALGEIDRLGKPDREFYQECASRSGMTLPEWWIVRNEI